jgi:A/G-specific adenine glycosylase
MLQQTQVSRVAVRWVRFLSRFPDPVACAEAPAADVVREWEGLGYNRRALSLHRAATAIRDHHDGRVPDDLEALLALPGVGPYTARAVLAFAFERDAAPVDTNIGRVLARLGGRTLTPGEAQRTADALVPAGRGWTWNQGIMELGALVCTKRSPRCEVCPLLDECAWRGRGADPAVGSAAVGRPQAPFAGSDRELRGRIVDRVRRGPCPLAELDATIAPDDAARRARVIDGLVADGLVERAGSSLRLVGDAQDGPVSDASRPSIA